MRKSRWLLCALAALLLAGCSLARPEEQKPGGGRFAGVYMLYTQENHSESFYENPLLEKYGAASFETDQFGTLDFPREVLFAVEDKPGNYVFPGMEGGYSLFLVEKHAEHGHVSRVVSNMAPGEEGNAIHASDEGTSNTLSGTIYCGLPLGVEERDEYAGNGIWKCYRVYQAEDGRLYLDGSGNSFGGGSSFGCGISETQATTGWSGETVTESIDVNVWVEMVDRMEQLVVTQFDENNAVVRSDDLALRDDLPKVNCEAETAWVLVEEIGRDGTVRTVYTVPEEGEDPVFHMVVLLDDEGLGKNTYLMIQ